MSQSMKAAVVRELGRPLTIEDMPIPYPADDPILVRFAATGVCHTDLHAARGDWPVKPTPPFIPGHEGVGYVAKAGRSVKRFKIDGRVVVKLQ
ncbi:alcohol dehydrogenase catalytic domain-containing protein [Rhizobium sp. KVB221]|uniref:Alcohol dehydrogenase catalytic domain-containing protein n=1 Tax=Rhizobium setariae TaxID=2801340 RepID=A0A936YVE0_9HYPH|nr:alcohol dehydrogenase catalytic domain-containing protein [Rhizobium setariae]MBL0373992.1 alcohol dehydrogenase catalytic domain-containing protein [Rhizobium setariae]